MSIMQSNELGKLVLMRHGETMWAKAGQFTGRTNLPLTSVGKQQARNAAPLLKGFNFLENQREQVFVSPLLRAQQTANQVGLTDFQTAHNLAEWDYGPLEGHTNKQLSDLIGHTYNIWFDGVNFDVNSLPTVETPIDEEGNRIEIAKLPGETLQAITLRATRFVEHIRMDLFNKKDILVVAHSQILRVVACVFLGIEPKLGSRLVLDTTGISCLGIQQGSPVVFNWNRLNQNA